MSKSSSETLTIPSSIEHDCVISTLPPHQFLKPTAQSGSTSPLTPDYPVTVGCVTFTTSTPNLLPYKGFGYLIPRSVPTKLNPHSALGVLFEHNATPDHDSAATPGTRLTVMLGGHHWHSQPSKMPQTNEDLIAAARETLMMQLDFDPDTHGAHAHASLNRDCIPQHIVGHPARVAQARQILETKYGPGKVFLSGTATCGPGVTDVVRRAYEVAFTVIQPEDPYQKEIAQLKKSEKR
jgi:protoporphyrinogen/coproporphyrinogen III oxidase